MDKILYMVVPCYNEEAVLEETTARLKENFEVNQVVVSANDLIDGGKKKKTFANQAFKEGEKVVFADLKVGDYVVHKNYGIGIFIGVNTITADETTKDYIKLKYIMRNAESSKDSEEIINAIKEKVDRIGDMSGIHFGQSYWNTATIAGNYRMIVKSLAERENVDIRKLDQELQEDTSVWWL